MVQATVDTTTRRRDFLALAAVAASTVLAAQQAVAAEPIGLPVADPVFDIVAAHAKSVGLVKAAMQDGRDCGDDFDDLCATEMDLFQELLKVVPTTLAGAVALVAHLDQVREQDPWKFEDNYATPLIGTLAQAFQNIGGKL